MDEQNAPNAQTTSDDATEAPQSDAVPAGEPSPAAPVAATPVPRRRFLAGSAALVAVVAGAGFAARQAFRGQGVTPSPSPTVPPVVGNDPATATPRREPTPLVDERADGYLVTAPRTLRANGVETVSFALSNGTRPVNSLVKVALTDKSGKPVAEGSEWVLNGRGGVPIRLGALAAGDYTLGVSGNGFTDRATVRVEDGTILFLETDKPIYKPGETIRIRLVALDVNLRPVATTATVEAQDAKGIKVFKKTVSTDAFGMATLDLPLSTEPNLGVWKLRAAVGESVGGNRATQLDVRVERYVLPKYEVKATLPKDWALVSERITGTIAAEYTFGKPVKGELEVVGMVYRGAWQQFGKATLPIDGSATFELPAAGYAAGSPGNAGSGGARLDITVREEATGYEETTSKLLTIVSAPVTLRLVPESQSFKPGLPLSVLVIAEGPDKSPVEANVTLTIGAQDAKYSMLPNDTRQVRTTNGAALLEFTPHKDAVMLSIQSSATVAGVSGRTGGVPLTMRAAYSPSGAFVRVEQATRGALKVGDTARFAITATKEARSFYYEVVSRGKVVFSDQTDEREIAIALMPYMAPEARLLVYQILPDSEVAADWVSFKVEGSLPQRVTVTPEHEEVKPGAELDVRVQTEGAARVGLVAVDRAVFILAENRLNLQQVFGEIERLYAAPQAEAHASEPGGGGREPVPVPGGAAPGGVVGPGPAGMGSQINPGAKEAFQGAGVVVLTNRKVPEGKSIQQEARVAFAASAAPAQPAASSAAASAAAAPMPTRTAAAGGAAADQGQAEPERTREFFPETWVWSALTTDAVGRGMQRVTAPDSITTWNFRAVALSQEKGLGIGEAELRVFQPFFVTIDLPYSAIRGEQFPVSIALYNYDSAAQRYTVELERGDWFDLLDTPTVTVSVEPKAVGAAVFTIQPNLLGVRKLKVTARGSTLADAIIKEIIIEPEGVQRETVENAVLTAGTPRTFPLAAPAGAIGGSHRALLAVTGSVLAQTIEGLENLLKMPYGCGEQNMLLFAPDVFIARYLKETGQNKPEIMAKAELLMITGYQRELTYRRTDGSFSAFGQSDKSGSLWLTAFVMKTFAQANGLIYIDEQVQAASRSWIGGQQKGDGSFDQVGFVHHQEMMGGVSGKTALTAYVAVALLEAGDTAAAGRAIGWLEGQLAGIVDPYALALTAYALGLAKSPRAAAARASLLAIATESDEGLSWGDGPQPIPVGTPTPVPAPGAPVRPGSVPPGRGKSAAIETTGYGALALLAGGDTLNAGRAVRWLSTKRGSLGGFGSTQDTIVALQALTASAATSRAEVDATVAIVAGSYRKEIAIQPANADVMQIVELPEGVASATVEARGKGQPVVQAVSRYNLPDAEVAAQSAFQLDVQYNTAEVATNDLITITAGVRFTPPEPVLAGMVVADIAVPTGFAPETSSIEALAKRTAKLKRWDVAGRKVIFYIEEMQPDESIGLTFQARALYPVRAQAVASQAYSYYRPEWRGEHLGTRVVVSGRA
jgi:CD109 antigen